MKGVENFVINNKWKELQQQKIIGRGTYTTYSSLPEFYADTGALPMKRRVEDEEDKEVEEDVGDTEDGDEDAELQEGGEEEEETERASAKNRVLVYDKTFEDLLLPVNGICALS